LFQQHLGLFDRLEKRHQARLAEGFFREGKGAYDAVSPDRVRNEFAVLMVILDKAAEKLGVRPSDFRGGH
jgi:hypothetical protein